MHDAAGMVERHTAGLARFAELSLSLGEALHDRTLAAETARDAADGALAFQRIARSFRQTVALEAKLDRERHRVVRETALDDARAHNRDLTIRRAKVRAGVQSLIWTECEGSDAEHLECDLDEQLAEAVLYDAFMDVPIETVVARIAKDLGVLNDNPVTLPFSSVTDLRSAPPPPSSSGQGRRETPSPSSPPLQAQRSGGGGASQSDVTEGALKPEPDSS